MTEPLDSSSDTEKMSEDNGDQTPPLVISEDKPLINRYEEVRGAYLQTKTNMKKLKGIEDNISKNRFDGILIEYQARLDELEPQKSELEDQIKQRANQLFGELVDIDGEIAALSAQIEESTQLYKTGIIEKSQHTRDTAPLAQRKKELQSACYGKEAEYNKLAIALRSAGEDTPMLSSSVRYAPFEVKAKATVEPVSYFQKLAIFFLVVGCLLPPVAWLLFLGMKHLGMGEIIPPANVVIQVIVLIVVVGYLFIGTRARYMSYFVTALFFLLISILCTTKLVTIDLNAAAYFEIMKKALCLYTVENPFSIGVHNYCGGVNFAIALIVFIVASLRDFFMGVQYEYNQ